MADVMTRRGLHYGWIVAAATFLTMLVTAGAVGAPGVLLQPLQREFGWSTAEISTALALRLLLFGLMGPFAAAFINRHGVRRVTLSALLLIGSALALSLLMGHLWQLIVLWGVVLGIGTGLTALVLAATVSARWFDQQRGLVVGLLTASSATGQLAFLPLLATLEVHYGWRMALLALCGFLVLAALVVFLFLRDRPGDLGLLPYGAEPGASVSAAPPERHQPVVAGALHALKDAARTRIFWGLFGTFFICGASTNGLIQNHFIPYCSDRGLGSVMAASVLATIGIFDFFGTVASGWLSDRVGAGRLLFWYYGLRGLSLIYMPFATFSYAGLSPFAIFYGLDWVATVPPTVNLTVRHFGRERSNVVFGWVFAGHQLGAATATLGAGVARTELGTYLPAFLAAGALCIIAAALTLTLEPAVAKRRVITQTSQP